MDYLTDYDNGLAATMRRTGRLLVALIVVAAGVAACGGGAETAISGPVADTAAPSVSISSPSSNGTFGTTASNVAVSGSASDNVAVSQVSWTNDRGGQGTASGTSSWSASIALQSGDNVIVVTAADTAGNESTATLTVTYTPSDTTAPSVTITAPTSDQTFTTTSDTINVGGTASDDTGVTEVTWANDRGGSGTASGTDNWSIMSINLQSGDNLITVTASDAAGNTQTDQITITNNTASSGLLKGIAILGDSNSDEYRADDNRGGAYASVTFNWMEQLVDKRGLNFGAWGSRPSPRRSGYAYNWALSGATASSMISGGQHTGVAGQVAAGDVTLVFIHIGFNDFARQEYSAIYNGSVSGAALTAKINNVISNITLAVDTVLGAGQVEIVLTDLYDYSVERPELLAAFPDASRRQAVTDAIRSVNSGLATMAQSRGVVLMELAPYVAVLFGGVDANGFINVGGELIDTVNPGDEPHHLNLNDSARHGGTVGNGLFANNVFVAPVNSAFGQLIVPFTELEILETAGIAP